MQQYTKNKGFCLWFTGLSASGKTTTVHALSEALKASNIDHDILDGDEIRQHLSKGLGFSKEDREENIKRVAWVASRIVRHGGVVLVSCITPYEKMREDARKLISAEGNFVEVFVDTPIEECQKRDPKGLYKKALAGEIKNFTGISDPFESPKKADLTILTVDNDLNTNVELLLSYLESQKLVQKNVRRALYIGRWQPLHNGHDHIIRKKLAEGVPVAIGVRNTPVSDSDPYSVAQRIQMIQDAYRDEDVIVFEIPDIESINIGRKVGYALNHYDVPQDIEGISATEIRKLISANDESWKSKVPQLSLAALEAIAGQA